ncbi:MAG: 30S ribosomal protein S15 [Bdellovibrionales bacterium]|nr:30S ribosomal protein S15 [Bdellovibrionales bacterium]
MALTKAQVEEIVRDNKRSEFDTGSCEVQVALLTRNIQELTEHFKRNKNDVHGQRGLVKMVNRRRKLLDYLKRTTPDRYTQIISKLALRK